MTNDFADRHVVVTGGAGALGTAVVSELLARGAVVHVPVYAPTELDAFAHRDHDRVHVRAGLDFTVEATVESYYGELPGLWASIHVAGGFDMKPIAETSLEDFLKLMNTNAVTCFLSCREAVRAIRRSGGEGRIVNVAAKPALVPTAGLAAYTASKAVVASLTHSLSEELAGEGIWVNAIAPSVIDTPANRKGMPDADHAAWPEPAQIAKTIAQLASVDNLVARGAIVPVYGRS
ncbi:MAG TPA: SDR family NAD(P)-dependent oxidoreductase [Sandaracinaceae bacterium LLY-WYZ-13_1]|nr:SDR family NAD(P)-dependent oxidoreductase [Sandaracinaceae bacterium LLY-WYZ-13_1]